MTTRVAFLRARLRDVATDAMLSAAEEVMIRKGYEKATMQDIAAAAGCAVGTLYVHFKNKEELFRAILQTHGKVLNERLKEAVGTAQTPLEKLRAIVVTHVSWAVGKPGLVDLLCSALPLRYYDFQESLSRLIPEEHGDYQNLGLTIIRAAQEAGQIRGDLSAEALNDMVGGVILTSLDQFAARPRPLAEQIVLVWGFISMGLQTMGSAGAQGAER